MAATRASNPGVNDKGMVTENHRLQKDAYFFYKANWRPDDPLLYITSNRATERTVAGTQVKAYTTSHGGGTVSQRPSLSASAKSSDIHVLLWPDVTLQPGRNLVEVTAHHRRRQARSGPVASGFLDPHRLLPAASHLSSREVPRSRCSRLP